MLKLQTLPSWTLQSIMMRIRPLGSWQGIIPAGECVKSAFALNLERKINSNVCHFC